VVNKSIGVHEVSSRSFQLGADGRAVVGTGFKCRSLYEDYLGVVSRG